MSENVQKDVGKSTVQTKTHYKYSIVSLILTAGDPRNMGKLGRLEY